MKKFLVIALLFFAFQLQAQVRIGETEAFATAKLFMQQQTKQQNISLSLNEVIGSKDSGQANLFVFTMNPRGFVIVSATNEVLAYSLVNVFPTSNELPDHIAYWLDLYNDQTDYLLQHPDQQKVPSKNQNAVEPLLTSCWGQGCFHNEACPEEENGPCGHVSAGCVAIAMAQIMYYHKQPCMGSGTLSYSCPPYGKPFADFGQTIYHWDEMADTLYESNPAVAELIYHCGVGVKMEYGAHLSLASNSNATSAFQQYFFYQKATFLRRDNSSDEEWQALIMENLERQLPVYYTGISSAGGHAFVCDGFDNNGLFHFNFGWYGISDGYYTLDAPYGFSVSQAIIYNLSPLPIINLEEEICEGDSFNFFGRHIGEAGHYSTIHANKQYELDLFVKPTIAVIPMEATICEGESYSFFGTPLWQAGHYSTTHDCISYELDLGITPYPTVYCSNDTLVEYGHPFQLKAFGADTYLWSTGDTTASITVIPLEDKLYTVTGFSEFGCGSFTFVYVKVKNNSNEMVLFPNPANDKVKIHMPIIEEVEILNLFGQPIDHVEAHREAVEIDVSRYVNGVYIVHVREMSKHSYKKLIIRH